MTTYTDQAQAQVMQSIASALGRTNPPAQVEAFDMTGAPQFSMMADLDQDQLVKAFMEEADRVGMRCEHATTSTLAETIKEVLMSYDVHRVAYPALPGFEEWNVPKVLQGGGFDEVVRWENPVADPADAASVEKVKADTDLFLTFMQTADAGITFAEYAIAETATVVQPGTAACPRSLAVLPRVHVAVVRSSRVVPRMTQIMASLENRVEAGEGMLSNIMFISGPSSTADIELVRVVGVHGPMEMVTILLDD